MADGTCRIEFSNMEKNNYISPITKIVPIQTEEMICQSPGKIQNLDGNNYDDPWADD